MALTGIILQALAGALYGASYILGDRIDKWMDGIYKDLAGEHQESCNN